MDNLSAETCPQYLGMSEDDLEAIGALAKCDPPVRTAEAVERLWGYLLDGTVDIVASDHSPHPFSRKTEREADFWTVAEGCTGIQTMLPVVLTEGRKRGLSWERLVQLMAERPADLRAQGAEGPDRTGPRRGYRSSRPGEGVGSRGRGPAAPGKAEPLHRQDIPGQGREDLRPGRARLRDGAPDKIVNRPGYGRYCPMEVRP